MKRVFSLILVFTMTLSLIACAKQEPKELTRVMFYLPDQAAIEAGSYGFETKEIEIYMPTLESLQAMSLVGQLVNEGALPEGCGALSFGVHNATLDMNASFKEALSKQGAIGETLLLGCLVNTMLSYFALGSITITAEGNVLQTGHETYDYPLTFYE